MLELNQLLAADNMARENEQEFIKIECHLQSNVRARMINLLKQPNL